MQDLSCHLCCRTNDPDPDNWIWYWICWADVAARDYTLWLPNLCCFIIQKKQPGQLLQLCTTQTARHTMMTVILFIRFKASIVQSLIQSLLQNCRMHSYATSLQQTSVTGHSSNPSEGTKCKKKSATYDIHYSMVFAFLSGQYSCWRWLVVVQSDLLQARTA